eukprot:gene12074-biopygen10293
MRVQNSYEIAKNTAIGSARFGRLEAVAALWAIRPRGGFLRPAVPWEDPEDDRGIRLGDPRRGKLRRAARGPPHRPSVDGHPAAVAPPRRPADRAAQRRAGGAAAGGAWSEQRHRCSMVGAAPPLQHGWSSATAAAWLEQRHRCSMVGAAPPLQHGWSSATAAAWLEQRHRCSMVGAAPPLQHGWRAWRAWRA